MEPDRWLGVELRHFLALDAVARTGSFGKAANICVAIQSTVSKYWLKTMHPFINQLWSRR